MSTGKWQCQSTLNVDSVVRGVAYSPSGDTIAVGCDNGKVLLVDAVTVTVKRSLTVDSALGVTSVAFSHDGSIIAAAYLKKIQLFDAQTQAKLGSPLSGHSR